MTTTISIPSLHLEYRLWVNELSFYKEELGLFDQHLTVLAERNTGHRFAAELEHFQNQFFLQKEVIDRLKHELVTSEKQLAAFIKDHQAIGFESINMDNHEKLRKDMTTFRKIYTELKESFRRFEANWS